MADSKVIRFYPKDGSIWELPAHVVADHRSKYYAETDPETTYEQEYAFVMKSDFELTDWMKNNMDWDDFHDHVKQIQPPAPVDPSDEFPNIETKVFRS